MVLGGLQRCPINGPFSYTKSHGDLRPGKPLRAQVAYSGAVPRRRAARRASSPSHTESNSVFTLACQLLNTTSLGHKISLPFQPKPGSTLHFLETQRRSPPCPSSKNSPCYWRTGLAHLEMSAGR